MDLPWYTEKLVLPAAFTLLGAVIGFLVAWAKDHLDARGAREAFLRAIGLELGGLEEQLKASLAETTLGLERLRTQGGPPPLLVGTLRNTVFVTQLGKLKDLNNPNLLEIVKFYSDLAVLERMLMVLTCPPKTSPSEM